MKQKHFLLKEFWFSWFPDICHQVLDLYSQANSAKTPESPPMTPSNEPSRERPTAPPSIMDSASNTPNGDSNLNGFFILRLFINL